MNILHVIDTLGVGGAEQMLVNLLPELVRNGDKVSVAVLRPPLNLREKLEAAGIEVHVLPDHNKWNLLTGARNIARIARQTDSDVVHAHLLFPNVYTGLGRILGLISAHTCVTYHNLAYAPGCNKPGPGLAIRKLLNTVSSRYGMDARIAVSNAVATHYLEMLRPGTVTVIPVAIPTSRIDATLANLKPEQRRDPGPLRIILPGRLVHEKGHTVLLDAMTRLRANHVDCIAVFAGGGQLQEALEHKVSEAGLAAKVLFTGRLLHDELLCTVASADIVVVPSLFEGFGTTAAEALTAGRAVVATRTGGLTDIIEDGVTGLLVEAGDDKGLAAAIERLAADPALRRRMGKAGRDRVLERFDVELVARELSALYSQLISKPA